MKTDQEYLEFRKMKHDKRMLESVEDFTITGVRLVSKTDEEAPGMVVNFTPEEAPEIIKAIKAVLSSRGI